jgi:PPM family protein phosphatase
MLRISGTGATHVGLVRDNNQDAGFVGSDLMVVADGVGGGAAGEVASATTVYAVSATAMTRRGEDPAAVLRAAVRAAQQQVAVGVARDADRTGMATTMTAILTDGSSFALAHIGDSRGYLFRGGRLRRITRDHTVVQDMVDAGALAVEDAAGSPWRNVVLRTINGRPDNEADVVPLPLEVGDRVLLASDGLTDLVPEKRIADLLGRHTDDDAAVQSLVATALGNGGRDNVTCLVASIIDGPRVSADGILLGSVRDVGNVVDPGAIGSRSSHTA